MNTLENPALMEPLFPESGKARLAKLTCEILAASGRLTGQVHSPEVLRRVVGLVREMNCYYSNLIEGHKTTPQDIERALKHNFSADESKRNHQRLSLAHIEVEQTMVERLTRETVDVYGSEFVSWLHQEFYQRLPEPLQWATTKSGKAYRIEPGRLRGFMVDVGRHTPPQFRALPKFLARFKEFYGSGKFLETDRLTLIAAAHHRLAWIHPFGDGNGRVIRLHTRALMIHHGLDGGGLWSLSRGLARQRQRYYEHLQAADGKRRNDLDGRGNLSDAGLAAHCQFFLETVLDQIQFMSGLLDLPALRSRVEHYFQFEAVRLKRHREPLMRLVLELVDQGEITRTLAQAVTGKGATVTPEIIKLGVREGLIESPSPKGPLQPGFPSKVLEFYFPRLYLDFSAGESAAGPQ
jgi:Fic family protein